MTKIYKLFLPIGIFALLLISSCELYNPPEPVPAYIHIQKFDLTTNYSAEGTNSNKISDAWIYVDDQLIGCFELPATVPVIVENGSHIVKVSAGIKVNGISSNRGIYPFYKKYEQTIDLQKGIVTTLSPTTSYNSTTTFAYKEDFEIAGVTIAPTANSDTTFQTLSSPDPNIFEGSKCGVAYIDNTKTFFEAATVNSFVLPKAGAPVFLEFNYKCTYEVTVSIIAYGSTASAQFLSLHLNPSPEWNKAYIYLTPNVSGASSALNYKMVWGMINVTGATSGAMYIDNIKLVY
ncbi:hypothetical protein BH10BAC1_BH10BAC1_10390 [soil metagenome]